jgi:D-alanyl-D-alanine carboxypeptidase
VRPVAPPARQANGTAFWDQHPDQKPVRKGDPWPPPEPPRAAPTRIEPDPEPEPEPAPEPTKRKRLLITAIAIVAVLGLAAGVVFFVPGVSDTLGLTDAAPEVVIKPPAQPVTFEPGLRAPGAEGPAPTAAGVEAALAGPASASALGRLTGIVLDPATGETLWQADPDTPLTPASTGKLLTAAAALLSLDHTAQLSTKVVAGAEPGSVVIVGGGDPTLSSLKPGVESVYPGAAHLVDLVDQVKASGAKVQTVQVDLSRYTGDSSAQGWLPADIGAGYITPIVPAMLDGGRADARAQNGARTANPARALAEEFATRIGATVPANADQTAPQDAKVLGEVRSAPMVELVDTILRTSDNVLAETISREVAIGAGKEASFVGGSEATLEVLRTNGFDLTGVEMADGSGLSTVDKVPAKLLGEILKVAAAPDGDDPRTAKLRPLLGGLPVAGGSGTLGNRYSSAEAAAGKGYVRAKTGTLSGVNSLAGIVLNQDGRVMVFALMTGDTDSSARPALDTMAATLRGCGCR